MEPVLLKSHSDFTEKLKKQTTGALPVCAVCELCVKVFAWVCLSCPDKNVLNYIRLVYYENTHKLLMRIYYYLTRNVQ